MDKVKAGDYYIGDEVWVPRWDSVNIATEYKCPWCHGDGYIIDPIYGSHNICDTEFRNNGDNKVYVCKDGILHQHKSIKVPRLVVISGVAQDPNGNIVYSTHGKGLASKFTRNHYSPSEIFSTEQECTEYIERLNNESSES